MIATGLVSKKLNCDKGQLRAMLFAAAWVQLHLKSRSFVGDRAEQHDFVEEALHIAEVGFAQYKRYVEDT